jgi:20S proteasome alpha/beta subunit
MENAEQNSEISILRSRASAEDGRIPKSEFEMTQVIACSTHQGIVVATDSRATWFDQAGEMKHFSIKKLLRLGSHSAMVSAGAGIGVEMSLAFQNFLQRQGAEAIDDIANMALFFFTSLEIMPRCSAAGLDFRIIPAGFNAPLEFLTGFTEQYGKWLSQRGMQHPFFPPMPDGASEEVLPLDEVYLILAGYSFRDRAQPYHLHLFSSEGEKISIKALPTSQIIVVPRSLSMERRLEAQCEPGSSLDQLLNLCKSFLKKRSSEGEEVGPPFYFATITPSGYKEIVEEEVK